MRFKTASGTVYDLTEIRPVKGNDMLGREYRAFLTRDGVPFRHVGDGSEMGEFHAQSVTFGRLPTIGESFFYWTGTHGGCISTPVESIESEETTL